MSERDEKLAVVADLFSQVGLRPNKYTIKRLCQVLIDRETDFANRVIDLRKKYRQAFADFPSRFHIRDWDDVYGGQFFVTNEPNLRQTTRFYPVYLNFETNKICFVRRRDLSDHGDKKIRVSFDTNGIYYSSEAQCIVRIKKFTQATVDILPDPVR